MRMVVVAVALLVSFPAQAADLAAYAGGVSIKLSGGRQEIVPAWRVACVERVTAR